MPKIMQNLKRAWKSLWNDSDFARGGDWKRYNVGGTMTDWRSEAGSRWTNPTVMACLSWLTKNFLQANPIVQTERNGEWEEVESPLLRLLEKPNESYNYHALMQATLLSWYCADKYAGNAFWHITFSGGGRPIALHWLPNQCITVKRRDGVLEYEYRVKGETVVYTEEEVFHLRNGLSPESALLGLDPLGSCDRDIYTAGQGSNFVGRLFKNFGLIGAMITPKGEGVVDPEELKRLWVSKTTGDNQGEPLVYDIPLEIQFPSVTPQSMEIGTILDRPESSICANFGIPPQVVGVHVGRLSKTYANMGEAREIAWEECLIPLMRDIALQIQIRLLPYFSPQWRSQRFQFDISDIRPLQPDLDALHTRAREDWKANLIDRYEWKVLFGMDTTSEDVGVYYQDTLTTPQPIERQSSINVNTAGVTN